MASAEFAPIFNALDRVLQTFVTGTVQRVVDYVDGPIVILGTVTFIGMGLLLLRGIGDMPLETFFKRSLAFAVVGMLAGSSAHYNDYLATHLLALPDSLYRLFSGAGPMDMTVSIGESMDEVAAKMIEGINTSWASASAWSLGGYVTAFVLMVILLIFGVAFVVSVGVMKIGVALVVAMGPLMILGLLHPATKDYFTRWLILLCYVRATR